MLVDGSSYLFRAYYALPALTNTKGQATGAILGVINMLKKLIITYSPKWMVVVFDSKQPTFRHELFPEYKINRTKMPEDLASQIPFLLEVIQALGLTVVQLAGVEADDIIGSLVHQVKNNNIFSIIATGDKDLAQLVNKEVVLVNTMTEVLLDHQGVINKFHVPPSKIIDYLALAGDQTDNIPGVANIGPKTAVKLLEQYADLAGIIKNCDQIPGKVGDNLRQTIKQFPLYIKLVTIDTSLNLKFSPTDFIIRSKDCVKLRNLFTELEIYSWLKELPEDSVANPVVTFNSDLPSATNVNDPVNFSLDKMLVKWAKLIAAVDTFAIYLTTDTNNVLHAEITGIYLAVANDDCYLKLENFKELIGSVKLNRNQNVEKYAQAYNLLKILNFLQDPAKTKITYNLKQLAQVLDNYAIKIEPKYFDVMLESYVLDSTNKLNLDLTTINAKKILALHDDLLPRIQKSQNLFNILSNIEIPLVMVLKTMERNGVLVDNVKLLKQSKAVNKRIEILEKATYTLAGKEFNLNSPKQLQEILYIHLGLPVLEKTPTGQPSTSETVLHGLAAEFELARIILEYRTLSKLQSTYIDKLPKVVDKKTGRIHTSYNQTITATGRLSSSEPNLQNIPIRTEEGKNIRNSFIARAGYKILAADYSQIELRILAHLSGDLGLINAFQEDLDIHTITASEIFQVDKMEINEELRRKAKAINFGLIYGMSDFGLARQLKISRLEAEAYIKTYFAKFPKVLEFMESTRKFAAKHGFVETLFGRRLYLPEINSKNSIKRKAAERAAINAPMQGGQADLIKLAMIKIHDWISNEAQDVFMLMQVHDELVFEIPDDLKNPKSKSYIYNQQSKIKFATDNIKHIMQEVAKLKVKLKVDVGVGDSWGEAH